MIHFTDQDIQEIYDLYVVQYLSAENQPTLEFFMSNFWPNLSEQQKMEMLWISKQMIWTEE